MTTSNFVKMTTFPFKCYTTCLHFEVMPIRHRIINTEFPDRRGHVANMGPTWVLSSPGGPHVGPMNLAIRVHLYLHCTGEPVLPGCRTGDWFEGGGIWHVTYWGQDTLNARTRRTPCVCGQQCGGTQAWTWLTWGSPWWRRAGFEGARTRAHRRWKSEVLGWHRHRRQIRVDGTVCVGWSYPR